jgi:hypothetical protein
MIKDGWNQLRGKGNSVDDLAKGVAQSADDVTRGAVQGVDDVARGAAQGVDDVARAGSLASRMGGLRMIAGGAARLAWPVALVADAGVRAYDSHKVESRHDRLEEAANQGLLSKEDMQKVTDERNAGHSRNAAGFVGGTAGAIGGAKLGGMIGASIGSVIPVAGTAVGGGVGLVIGGFVGYLGGSKIGETASDMVTGHDASYAHTQQAMANLEANRLVTKGKGAEAGEAWAKAREKSGYVGAVETPGQVQGAEAQKAFEQNMSYTTSPIVATPTATTEVKPALKLSRGKSTTSYTNGQRESVSVTH